MKNSPNRFRVLADLDMDEDLSAPKPPREVRSLEKVPDPENDIEIAFARIRRDAAQARFDLLNLIKGNSLNKLTVKGILTTASAIRSDIYIASMEEPFDSAKLAVLEKRFLQLRELSPIKLFSEASSLSGDEKSIDGISGEDRRDLSRELKPGSKMVEGMVFSPSSVSGVPKVAENPDLKNVGNDADTDGSVEEDSESDEEDADSAEDIENDVDMLEASETMVAQGEVSEGPALSVIKTEGEGEVKICSVESEGEDNGSAEVDSYAEDEEDDGTSENCEAVSSDKVPKHVRASDTVGEGVLGVAEEEHKQSIAKALSSPPQVRLDVDSPDFEHNYAILNDVDDHVNVGASPEVSTYDAVLGAPEMFDKMPRQNLGIKGRSVSSNSKAWSKDRERAHESGSDCIKDSVADLNGGRQSWADIVGNKDNFEKQPRPLGSRSDVFSVEKSPVKYFMEEMYSGNSLRSTTTLGNDKERQKVYDTMFRLPWRCELLIDVGVVICVDSFLSLLTIMPTRILMTVWRLLITRQFDRPSAAELSDLGCFIVLACGVALLQQTDISLIYHMIRGQGTIKLYVVYNVLEIFDKLCQNFGGDVLQTLFNSAEGLANCSPESMRYWIWRFISDEALAMVSSIVHSFILLAQAITLSTCIVAHNNALFALLVSNNFAEIKSNVFKRFSRDNIQSLVYHDSVERFHISAFVLFVLAQNILEADGPWFESFLFNAFLVYICEVMIDIIKHSFVAKFNDIKPITYSEFLEDLCKQTLNIEMENGKKNLTFVPLAPACVVIRVLAPVYAVHLPYSPLPWRLFWMLLLSSMTFVMLASLKVMIRMGLKKHAKWYINRCQKRKLHSD